MEKPKKSLEACVKWYCCSYDNCTKYYTAKYNLKKHIETVHLKSYKYTCLHCNKNYASKQNLEQHLNFHTGRTPYVCPVCKASFKQGSQLSLHKRIHSSSELGRNKKFKSKRTKRKTHKPVVDEDYSVTKSIDIDETKPEVSLPRIAQKEFKVTLPSIFDLIESEPSL